MRGDTGERKPNAVPVHFAPGASSATLHGTVSRGWYDEYELVAAAGQRVTLAGPSALIYSLVRRGHEKSMDLRPGASLTLPMSGAYLLEIDSDGERGQAYRATITIR